MAPGYAGAMDGPDQWQWIWLAATVVFAVGEMSSPGSFFLAPFAVGALVAAILSFAGVAVAVGWIAFIVVSVLAFASLRPLARRINALTADSQAGVGATRLIGETAIVLDAIGPEPDAMGMVRVGREEWRAATVDGSAVAAGAAVSVAEVRGTRLLVHPSAQIPPTPPPTENS